MRLFLLCAIPLVVLSACSGGEKHRIGGESDDTAEVTGDSAETDSDTTDSDITDSETTDSGTTDSDSATDSGTTDTGETTDSGSTDSGTADDTSADTGSGSTTGEPDLDGDGWSVADGDCDDYDARQYPGADETCDGIDEDCDDDIDEEAIDANPYYPDVDADGYGSDEGVIFNCYSQWGYVSAHGDCDDSDSSVHPGAAEIAGDGVDQDCDGSD